MNMRTKECKGMYSDIPKRLNLQAIGHLIQDGSGDNNIYYDSFTQRVRKAEKELQKELEKQLGEEKADEVMTLIAKYSFVKEGVQLSLGMKIGAKMALLLTDESEYDF